MLDYKETQLEKQDLQSIYQAMDLARKIDERMWLLNRAGKIPFVISCQGQEATQVGAAYALEKGDVTAPYYRDLALVTYLGITPLETMYSVFGKRDDVSSGGKQMPSHFSKKEIGIMSQGSSVATQLLHAIGAALTFKMDNKPQVALSTLGEGSSNQGDFHEGLNFVGVHKLPFICIIENNQYAISVSKDLQYGAERLSDRAKGYGMFGITVDGNDPIAVYKAVKEARKRALKGEGGTLIEAMCTRLTAHSSDDDDRYRDDALKKADQEQDCNHLFKQYLLEQQLIDHTWLEKTEQVHQSIVNDATKEAENAPYPEVSETYTHVYEKGGPFNA
ncbi:MULTISPECIES: thiamine pyrophosphate-dependent dehydrogenase E1 component subunit alpha [unclassified Staphylococcus]|uniref:thiamine pyrophosphate-dependent dehydrogenase E1 component subunit alpha n=1 Tax=unclassified Staphylococcus TaxID=91994 RepID=UPI0021D1595E|nr:MULTISPECIES: thiamine pyrophosphate-dependent dehydrogenase E1 component subunit alpha [unclassified Staphylococcus]UXR70757.1 thiamine pyrophosphate-dependent dehydrogenase E1 component subunit alpha [Staphylococcus sp. IVB6240]UXR72988.1 thiamine pyrophosphate-dependent dehydrogenase E1 component subunit alpha [Staphylococcus sp. IVB6238]UXR75283.1 thiamine pyrophosphate-dependent dehydrogenase E1 component subunit alpha [Staphylococcus sp. IVB6233]UXR79485.1 thiamine pyrophosphate-depend